MNVTVSVRPDPLFERDGFDVWCDIPITYTQAVLGDEIVVPTIDGKVSYNNPRHPAWYGVPSAQQGHLLCQWRGRGDQYVKLNIEVPKGLSGKQKDRSNPLIPS